jgi:hypothetical protein
MSEFVKRALNDDFMWDAISSHLPAARKSNTDFLNFNCPVCGDRKGRGGVKKDIKGIGVFCFNCDLRILYANGDPLSRRLQSFLSALGLSEREVKMLNFRALQIRKIVSSIDTPDRPAQLWTPRFRALDLPPNTYSLSTWAEQECSDPQFIAAAEYALSRGEDFYERGDLMWSSDKDWADRLIIPFFFRGEIAGWTGRAVTKGQEPKYKNNMQTDYLFNNHLIGESKNRFLVLVEGVPDAIAIGGVSPLGAKLSANQASWLKSTGKRIIVVPDRDEAGGRMIDHALNNEWMVAFPRLAPGRSTGNNWWDESCKDCADAVQRHGRLYTLRSIIETATDNKLEINVKRKWMI